MVVVIDAPLAGFHLLSDHGNDRVTVAISFREDAFYGGPVLWAVAGFFFSRAAVVFTGNSFFNCVLAQRTAGVFLFAMVIIVTMIISGSRSAFARTA